MDVGIVGGSGYGGGELLRLLAQHPTLKIRTVAARSAAGKPVVEVFPNLLGMPGSFVAAQPEAFEGCAAVFLATPHAASMELAPALLDVLGPDAVVVDLSGAFRLGAQDFETAYAMEHTAPALAPAPYGLPELHRADLRDARLIAGPGCYPTAALLALAPLAGLVDPASVVIAGLSGTSGAGKGLREDLHASHVMGSTAPYGAPTHRHTSEVATQWAALTDAGARVTFVPHLVPMPRGLLATATATLLDPGTDLETVRMAYAGRYDAEPFVSVLPAGQWPATAHVAGGNAAHVGVAVDAAAGRVIASCAIDNLVKGAAGQALQCANLALGLPEGAGLSALGVYP